jgi:hypothetical protein
MGGRIFSFSGDFALHIYLPALMSFIAKIHFAILFGALDFGVYLCTRLFFQLCPLCSMLIIRFDSAMP